MARELRAAAAAGGRGWIRTIEARSNRFTVCPLWPLGNSPIFGFVVDGAGGRTRTPDLLITNQLLYQLSYTSLRMCHNNDYYNTRYDKCQALEKRNSKKSSFRLTAP